MAFTPTADEMLPWPPSPHNIATVSPFGRTEQNLIFLDNSPNRRTFPYRISRSESSPAFDR